jgi:hypothetical protein
MWWMYAPAGAARITAGFKAAKSSTQLRRGGTISMRMDMHRMIQPTDIGNGG